MLEKIFKTLEVAVLVIGSLCAFALVGVALFGGNFHPAMIVFAVIGIVMMLMAVFVYGEQKEEEKK